jgi:AraC-like DNA-binding protein
VDPVSDFDMAYKEFRPPPALSGCVQAFWILEGDAPAGEDKVYRLLPYGCPRLVIHYHNLFRTYPDSGSCGIIPIAVLNGHTYHYQEYVARGQFRFAGAYLYPFVPGLLFGLAAKDYINRVLELESLLEKPIHANLQNRVLAAKNNEERIGIMASFLMERLTKISYQADPLHGMIMEIISQKGNISVTELTKLSGLSARQLDRKFSALVGIPPKLFSRIVRFQSTLALNAACAPKNLTRLALDSGYYDQAHFIHEFKHFAGFSPAFYFSKLGNSVADIMCAITH